MSKTLMRHPDRPERVVSIPLNEWARYRRQGYEFCNEASVPEEKPEEIAPGGEADPPAPAVEEEVAEETPTRRRTAAKDKGEA